jgi:hypothetical protein
MRFLGFRFQAFRRVRGEVIVLVSGSWLLVSGYWSLVTGGWDHVV